MNLFDNREALFAPWKIALIMLLTLAVVPQRATSGGMKVEPLDVVSVYGLSHFRVEIADTFETRETGLMHRRRLGPHQGMLFDFKTTQPVTFWMKDTWIALDLLFIDADGKIVAIAKRAHPMDESLIPSGGAVLGVLELRGGRADEIGAKVGDRVRHRIFSH